MVSFGFDGVSILIPSLSDLVGWLFVAGLVAMAVGLVALAALVRRALRRKREAQGRAPRKGPDLD